MNPVERWLVDTSDNGAKERAEAEIQRQLEGTVTLATSAHNLVRTVPHEAAKALDKYVLSHSHICTNHDVYFLFDLCVRACVCV